MTAHQLADLLRVHRKPETQADFSRRVGLSESMIAHVETGRRSLSVESTIRVADALELDSEDRAELMAARDRKAAELSNKPGLAESPNPNADDTDALYASEVASFFNVMTALLPAIAAMEQVAELARDVETPTSELTRDLHELSELLDDIAPALKEGVAIMASHPAPVSPEVAVAVADFLAARVNSRDDDVGLHDRLESLQQENELILAKLDELSHSSKDEMDAVTKRLEAAERRLPSKRAAQ